MAITTAMCVSFKSELLQASHCFNAAPGSPPTGNVTNASASVSTVSSLTGISVGQTITGTGIPAATVVAGMPTTSSLTLSKNATATNTGVTLTLTGDVFNIALIKGTPVGSFGATTSNYSQLSTDETSGTGYTAGGLALGNVTPTNDGVSVAWTSFTPNPTWAGATFDTSGCIIYSASARNAGVTGRAVSVHSFSGIQSVTSGSLTILIPSPAAGTALLRLS